MPPSNVMFISCGSFSPVTHMHLRMFELARDHLTELGHTVLGGIISPVHDAYAKDGLVAATHRTAMVRLALHSSAWVRLSDWECMQQDKWTRTRTSLQYHQNYVNSVVSGGGQDRANSNVEGSRVNGGGGGLPAWLPAQVRDCTQPVQLRLLCGADLLESFAKPGLWQPDDIEAILVQHGLVVISRSGSNPERFIFESDILTRLKQHITIVTNWVPNEVSSSLSRRLLSRGQSVKYLMDDAVIEYIQKFELYGARRSAATKYIIAPQQIDYLQQVLDNAQQNAQNTRNTIATSARNVINYRYDDMDETDYPPPPPPIAAGNEADHQPLLLEKRPGSRVFCCTDKLGTVGKLLLARPGGAVKVLAPDGSLESSPDSDRDDTLGDSDEVGDGRSAQIAQQQITPAEHKTIRPHPSNVCTLPPAQVPAHSQLPPPPPPAHVAVAGGGHSRSSSTASRVQFVLDDVGDAADRELSGGGGDGEGGKMPDTSERQDELIQFVFTRHGIRVISNKEYVV